MGTLTKLTLHSNVIDSGSQEDVPDSTPPVDENNEVEKKKPTFDQQLEDEDDTSDWLPVLIVGGLLMICIFGTVCGVKRCLQKKGPDVDKMKK